MNKKLKFFLYLEKRVFIFENLILGMGIGCIGFVGLCEFVFNYHWGVLKNDPHPFKSLSLTDVSSQNAQSLEYALRLMMARPRTIASVRSDSSRQIERLRFILLAELEKGDGYALNTIERELKALRNDSSTLTQRVFLLQSLQRIQIDQVDDNRKDEIRRLALDQLLLNYDRELENSNDSEKRQSIRMMTLIAYQVFLQTKNDPESSLSGTLQGLQVHEDSEIRSVMIEKFTSRYPDLKTEFYSRLGQNE